MGRKFDGIDRISKNFHLKKISAPLGFETKVRRGGISPRAVMEGPSTYLNEFGVRSESLQGPFGVCSGSVRDPFGPISVPNFRSPKFQNFKNVQICAAIAATYGRGPLAAVPSPAAQSPRCGGGDGRTNSKVVPKKYPI